VKQSGQMWTDDPQATQGLDFAFWELWCFIIGFSFAFNSYVLGIFLTRLGMLWLGSLGRVDG